MLGSPSVSGGILSGRYSASPFGNAPLPQGSRQSPISIVSQLAKPMNLDPLMFENYNPAASVKVYNDGHSLKVEPKDPSKAPFVSGGPLTGIFGLAQMHFHWGKVAGSEHTFNGRRYPAEGHAVFYNTKYRSFADAKDKSDGLAVIAFFIQEDMTPYADLNALLRKASMVTKMGQSAEASGKEAFSWLAALEFQPDYYTYQGSLTTPPFSENVIFMVFPVPFSVERGTVAGLRELKDGNGAPISENFRAVQPLNNRVVIRAFN